MFIPYIHVIVIQQETCQLLDLIENRQLFNIANSLMINCSIPYTRRKDEKIPNSLFMCIEIVCPRIAPNSCREKVPEWGAGYDEHVWNMEWYLS